MKKREKKTFTIYYINNQQQQHEHWWWESRGEKQQQQQRSRLCLSSRGFFFYFSSLDFCSHRRCGQTQFKYFNHEIIRNVMLYQWEWKFMGDLCCFAWLNGWILGTVIAVWLRLVALITQIYVYLHCPATLLSVNSFSFHTSLLCAKKALSIIKISYFVCSRRQQLYEVKHTQNKLCSW